MLIDGRAPTAFAELLLVASHRLRLAVRLLQLLVALAMPFFEWVGDRLPLLDSIDSIDSIDNQGSRLETFLAQSAVEETDSGAAKRRQFASNFM